MRPQLILELDDPGRAFQPGDVLAGQFALRGAAEQDVRAIELSVLWHTEGKGEEDMSVHHFERIEPRFVDGDIRQPRRFSTVLPNSPLSYRGAILRIIWCVRLRVFLTRGKEFTTEARFQLGTVPQAQRVLK